MELMASAVRLMWCPRLYNFFTGISGEGTRVFIIFLLANRRLRTIDSQKNDKTIERLPRICSSKKLQSRGFGMIRILFVCMGNICRSPAGAAILRHLVDSSRQDDKVKVDSCGLADWCRGDPPDERMVEALQIRGIGLEGRAKPFTLQFLDEFTHVLAVDREVLTQLHRYAKTPQQKSKIVLLTAFSVRYPEQDVPDPYGGGQQAFELVLDMLEDACEGFLKTL